ncbi:MAG: hypothetical protein ABI606_16335 [Rhodoferax sp.]
MRKTTALVLTVLAVAILAGCGKQETDCTKPTNKKEQGNCAHKAATEPRGPNTLPANPTRWGIDGMKNENK